MNLVEINNISLKIHDNLIIHDISMQLKKGQITTLIGPNGGGKTSIAKISLQLIKPSTGEVLINKNTRKGYMPQKINLDRSISLNGFEFIKLNSSQKLSNKYIQKLIDQLDLAKHLTKPIYQLSGGQLQKILFLRSIVNNPSFLVLDEPTQYMDIDAIANFYHILNEIRNNQDCAILMVSHDLNLVMQKSDHVICINHHICCQGNAKSLSLNPQYNLLFNHKINNHHNAEEIAIYQHQHNHVHNQ